MRIGKVGGAYTPVGGAYCISCIRPGGAYTGCKAKGNDTCTQWLYN